MVMWKREVKNQASGKRLEGAYLQSAMLRETDFREAHLEGANLRGADLWKADLSGAHLRGADLRNTFLKEAKLWDADLQDADLTGSSGLLDADLAGANLCRAKLPKALQKFEGLKQVEELSKNAGTLFTLMLSACAYSWLTIFSTTDVALVTNSASSQLPIINVSMPILYFYWVTPLALIGLYLYFHLYLQRLWEALAALPAVFPDGKTLDVKTYPWLLNDLVRAHFPQLRTHRPALSWLQGVLCLLTGWGLVPLTLVLFWGRYLRRHDWGWTILHILLLNASIWGGASLYRTAKATLGRREQAPFSWPHALKDWRSYSPLSLIALLVFFRFISLGAIEGNRTSYEDLVPIQGKKPRPSTLNLNLRVWVRKWVPNAMERVHYSPFADLFEADVSARPPNWTGEKDGEIGLVRGARLDWAHLEYADARNAFLVKAVLRSANLQGADLQGADLREADLQRADLQGTMLQETNLQRADLQRADLQRADLRGTDLRGTNLYEAHLQSAFLFGDNLQGANLRGSQLQGADLREAHLKGADLQWANLRGADLRGADLQGSTFNHHTHWPADYHPMQHGAQLVK